MNGRFVLKASGEQYLFNLKAGNNEAILTSERYTAKASALKASTSCVRTRSSMRSISDGSR
jgi:uncharacterized protein YegP (UPF0339 family)